MRDIGHGNSMGGVQQGEKMQPFLVGKFEARQKEQTVKRAGIAGISAGSVLVHPVDKLGTLARSKGRCKTI